MTANVDAMVRAGVEAYRAGKKAEARTLLERAIELDGYNEMAWLWLSAVVESPEEQQTCLENVLTINPNNDRAKQGLRSLGINPDAAPSPSAGGQTPAFEVGTIDEYFVPSSSSSVGYAGPQTSSAEYDDWVSNLNLGSSSAPAKGNDVFSDVDFSADEPFRIDDNLFTADPYGYDEVAADDDYIDDGLFDDPADELYADGNTYNEFANKLSDADYDESLFDEDPLALAAPKTAPKAAPRPAAPQPSFSTPEPMFTGLAAFRQIPAEIPVGRMPGTVESVAGIHYAIVTILVLVNLGAIAFIAMQFITG